MPVLEGFEVAVARQVNSMFKDSAWTRPSFLGRLYALDTFYNKGIPLRWNPVGVTGGKMRVNFWRGNPLTEGVNALNPDYAQRALSIVKRSRHIAGDIDVSYYQGGEPIDKAEAAALANDQQLANLGVRIAQAAKNSILTKWNEDLFPAVNLHGGSSAAIVGSAPDRIMPFAYPLQTGFANNAQTGTGTYMYMGIDLNDEPELKAINVGTESSTYTATPQNIERDLLMPLREERGANVDIMLMPKANFVHFKALAEDKQGSWPYEKMRAAFGSMSFVWQDVYVVWEPRLDLLPKKEIYIGDSSTIRFGSDFNRDDYMSLIKDWPANPSAHLLQWFLPGAFFNENPRFWGRVYNAAVP